MKWLYFLLDSLDKVEAIFLLTCPGVSSGGAGGTWAKPSPSCHPWSQLRQLSSETTSILRRQLWASLALRGSLLALYRIFSDVGLRWRSGLISAPVLYSAFCRASPLGLEPELGPLGCCLAFVPHREAPMGHSLSVTHTDSTRRRPALLFHCSYHTFCVAKHFPPLLPLYTMVWL